MGTAPDLTLAIRTIAVSARAAIDSSNKIGRPDVAAECARRGLVMLDGMREQLGADAPEEARQALEAAVRELRFAADASADADARPIGPEVPSGT